jgi:hypothetical protein
VQAGYAAPVSAVATGAGDVLARDVLQRLKDHPDDLTAHLHRQLLGMIKDEQVPLPAAIAALPQEDRDLLSVLLDGLANFKSGVQQDPTQLPSRKVKPLLEMADRLRALAELTIPTMVLCQRVDGFGMYTPMPTTFKAGLDHETLIYCEIENFSSRRNDQDRWETKLSMEAVLYTDSGQMIMTGKDDVSADLSRNRRRDFFVVKKLKLPRSLGPSRYILKVTIVDEQAKRVAENSVPIMMMAQ